MSGVSPVSREIETELRAIYNDMSRFLADFPRNQDFGYKIFNSPPLHRPRVLFIGYQPGGKEDSFQYEVERMSHLTWPTEAEYATAPWQLAVNMRRMFGSRLDLRQCVGMNGIFLRSPSVKQYRKDVGRGDRKRLEEFCRRHVLRIVDLLEPQSVVCIGFDALKLFCKTPPAALHNEEGGVLVRTGNIGPYTANAVLHLSGCRISAPDRRSLADFIIEESGGNTRAAA